MSDLKRVNTGERVTGWPDRTWNQVIDHVERARAAQRSKGGEQLPAGPGPVYARIRNDTGAALNKGGVVKLGDVLVEPTDDDATAVFQGLQFAGETPTGDAGEHLAIVQQPLAIDECGAAAIVAAAWARVNVTDAGHSYASPDGSTTLLESQASGVLPIIWKQEGTGEKWAVVKVVDSGNAMVVALAATTGAVSTTDSTFTVTNAVLVQGSPGVTLGDPLTVNNRQLGTESGMDPAPNAFGSGEWLLIAYDQAEGEWYLMPGPERASSSSNIEGDESSTAFQDTPLGRVLNGTGRLLFANNRHILDATRKFILASESPESFIAKVDTAPPETLGDLDILGTHCYRFPCGEDYDASTPIVDPFEILGDLSEGDYVYVRLMRGSVDGFTPGWYAVVIGPLKGEKGDPGEPGEPSGDGLTEEDVNILIAAYINANVDIGRVFLATVNEASHVTGSDGTFNFDDTSAIIGTAPESGECNNTFARAFIDGEKFLCFGFGTTYHAVKISPNIAWATVNKSGGVALSDSTFSLDGFASIINAVPSSDTADNTRALQLADNQVVPVILKDNGNWEVLRTVETGLFQVTSEIGPRTGLTWGTGTGTLLKKDGAGAHTATGGTSGITIYNSTSQTAEEDEVIQCKKIDGDWFWDVADCASE